MKDRTYAAIDLKSFYASVECMERTTHLVVADASRTEKTICLAVSPSLKAYGISGRARLFGVIQCSYDIYNVYLKYIAPEDIHVYSIDEVMIDLTDYLDAHSLAPRELVRNMILDVLKTTGITAAAGIGTNLYLAKVAMDIEAKRIPADENGVRIAQLGEMSYRRALWEHRQRESSVQAVRRQRRAAPRESHSSEDLSELPPLVATVLPFDFMAGQEYHCPHCKIIAVQGANRYL